MAAFCSKCEFDYKVYDGNFYKTKNTENGHQLYCINCCNAYQKEYSKNNKAKIAVYQKKYLTKVRDKKKKIRAYQLTIENRNKKAAEKRLLKKMDGEFDKYRLAALNINNHQCYVENGTNQWIGSFERNAIEHLICTEIRVMSRFK